MDNAIVVDGVLAAVLIFGTVYGAHRGLIKSLAGLAAVVAALIGSVMLANLLTEPVTDMVAPKVEDAVVKKFSEALEKASGAAASASADGQHTLTELFDQYDLPKGLIDGPLAQLTNGMSDAAAGARDKAEASFREAVSPKIRAIVRSTVHTVLVLVLYAVLLIVCKLLLHLVDHVFDLPVLSTVNGVGGAAIGLAETAVLLCVAVNIAVRFGFAPVAEHTDDTHLLPLFLNFSPLEWFAGMRA